MSAQSVVTSTGTVPARIAWAIYCEDTTKAPAPAGAFVPSRLGLKVDAEVGAKVEQVVWHDLGVSGVDG